jgi:3-isopropylmalate/(R)-2-methylmalate dehydratase small subunit
MNLIESTVVPLNTENVDTDQIIPARFLKATSREGFGKNLFRDWRYENNDEAQPKKDFPLNNPKWKGSILVAGKNFGCGSSREHAAWSIKDYGFEVVVSSFFADIFRNNALKNGLLPVIVDVETHKMLFDLMAEVPHAEVNIDLATQTVSLPNNHSVSFPIDSFSKTCLLKGVDELGYILSFNKQILAFEGQQ